MFALTLIISIAMQDPIASLSDGPRQERAASASLRTKREAAVNKRMEADLVKELAQRLAEISFAENAPVLLYAEAGRAWVGGSIYASYPDRIAWLDVHEDDPLDIALRLWEVMSSDKKWRGITLLVSGNEFRTEFDYGEGWSPDEDEGDRREPIVRAYFGDKPIYYPPLEGAEPWPED